MLGLVNVGNITTKKIENYNVREALYYVRRYDL